MSESAPLSHDQTLELIAMAQKGDDAAQEALIVNNAALVKSIVKKFTNRGTEYDDLYQGYDTTLTHVEFAKGFQIERKLYDDDLSNIMDQRPKGLANAAQRTREGHGARILNNAFANSSSSLLQAKVNGLVGDFMTPPLTPVEHVAGFALGGVDRLLHWAEPEQQQRMPAIRESVLVFYRFF